MSIRLKVATVDYRDKMSPCCGSSRLWTRPNLKLYYVYYYYFYYSYFHLRPLSRVKTTGLRADWYKQQIVFCWYIVYLGMFIVSRKDVFDNSRRFPLLSYKLGWIINFLVFKTKKCYRFGKRVVYSSHIPLSLRHFFTLLELKYLQ